jgi:hypothetical protein
MWPAGLVSSSRDGLATATVVLAELVVAMRDRPDETVAISKAVNTVAAIDVSGDVCRDNQPFTGTGHFCGRDNCESAPQVRAAETAVAQPRQPCAVRVRLTEWVGAHTGVASNRSRSGVRCPVGRSASCSSRASERISSGAARVCAANHSSPRGLARTRRQ